MNTNGLLSDVEGWNVLLSGYMKTKVINSVMLLLEDMDLTGLKPNLDTFKTIVKGLVSMKDYDAYVMAIFFFWREFAKDYPVLKPDIGFLNMLILCCRKSRHLERAVYFLYVINQCQLTPNVETFRELLTVSLRPLERTVYGPTVPLFSMSVCLSGSFNSVGLAKLAFM